MGRNFWAKLSANRMAWRGTRTSSSASSETLVDPFLWTICFDYLFSWCLNDEWLYCIAPKETQYIWFWGRKDQNGLGEVRYKARREKVKKGGSVVERWKRSGKRSRISRLEVETEKGRAVLGLSSVVSNYGCMGLPRVWTWRDSLFISSQNIFTRPQCFPKKKKSFLIFFLTLNNKNFPIFFITAGF